MKIFRFGNRRVKKMIVVDTSALIERPDVVCSLPGQVFIPLTVIKQLDGLKNSDKDDVRKKARQASQYIEAGIKEMKISVPKKYDQVDGLDNVSDNKIVGTAVWLKKIMPDAEVNLLTTDRNMRIVASAHGIKGVTMGQIKNSKKSFKNSGSLVSDVIIIGSVLIFPVLPLIVYVFLVGTVIDATSELLYAYWYVSIIVAFFGYLGGILFGVYSSRKGRKHNFAIHDQSNMSHGGSSEDWLWEMRPGSSRWMAGMSPYGKPPWDEE